MVQQFSKRLYDAVDCMMLCVPMLWSFFAYRENLYCTTEILINPGSDNTFQREC